MDVKGEDGRRKRTSATCIALDASFDEPGTASFGCIFLHSLRVRIKQPIRKAAGKQEPRSAAVVSEALSSRQA